MNLRRRQHKQKSFNERLADIERSRRKTERRKNRQLRRERIAKLIGMVAGQMFGTTKVGWVAVAVAAIVGAIVIMRIAR